MWNLLSVLFLAGWWENFVEWITGMWGQLTIIVSGTGITLTVAITKITQAVSNTVSFRSNIAKQNDEIKALKIELNSLKEDLKNTNEVVDYLAKNQINAKVREQAAKMLNKASLEIPISIKKDEVKATIKVKKRKKGD